MAPDNGEEALDDAVLGATATATATANPKLQHEASEDITMSNAADDVFATPQHSGPGPHMIPGSASVAPVASVGRRPQTRSMTRNQAAPIFARLQAASSRPKAKSTASTSKLEDAEDIEYASGYPRAQTAQSPKVDANVNQGRISKARGSVRNSPRPRRKRSLRSDLAPESIEGNSQSTPPPRKRRATRTTMASPQQARSIHLRRSARLSKPLTEFQKYAGLPNELKLAIWEAACEPRLVYIRNRAAPFPSFDIQNTAPVWFDADEASARIASERYRKMFSLHTPYDPRTEQPVNPDMDIVLVEPCCSGCRLYHCARRQFTDKDRLAIQRMAVQTESPWLMPNVDPCWSTISLAWGNVETLYLVQTAVTGNSKNEKVMYRVSEGNREADLRKRFGEWKKQGGKDRVLSKLEFVAVVPKGSYIGDREKIIIG
ncbi:hypothetical protein PG993_008820 [Apiospora rasikravindrae]|uniref:2EXR domain-containing protein n=1 Tax=Apiospora rasikravindrae TaxID=990691 RepID=A0ABR1SPE7_9PEZI